MKKLTGVSFTLAAIQKTGKWLLPFVLLGALSCAESKEEVERYHSDLPNYGNIDFKGIFKAQDTVLADRSGIVDYLSNYYLKNWELGNLSGGFLVAKGNDILFEAYRGYGREDQQMPVNEHTAMHVASVSKPLTAMAVLKLVEAGELKLNTPVVAILPKFPYPEITVEMLLKQRSGLPKYEHFLEDAEIPEGHFVTNQEVLDYMSEHKPALLREPGTGFMYCNTNYMTLALIVEKLTKTPFPEAMQEMVFKPLKMEHTFIFERKDIGHAAQSFFNGGQKVFPLDYLDLIYGDKNVYTTPRDLLRFSEALFSTEFLKPELKDLIFKPYSNEKAGVNNYGIGFRMKIYPDGEKLTYHNGWWHGSNAVFAHLLKSKVTIIAIGNAYSRKVYSALSLSALFEPFPYELESYHGEPVPEDSLVRDSSNTKE